MTKNRAIQTHKIDIRDGYQRRMAECSIKGEKILISVVHKSLQIAYKNMYICVGNISDPLGWMPKFVGNRAGFIYFLRDVEC